MRIYHGKILSLDSENHVYNYLVEDRGRIAYVGDELRLQYRACTDVLELGRRVLLPAFGDGHIHFSNWALIAVAFFDVRAARTIGGIQDIVRQQAARRRKARAIVAFGVSRHSVSEKRLITRDELDRAWPHTPLIIVCYDGHSAVCNSKMMDRFPAAVRGLSGFDARNGHLFHEAYLAGMDHATSLVSPLDLVRSIAGGFDRLAARGVGMMHAVEGVGFPRDLDVTLAAMAARARARKNGFQTRLFFQTMDVGKVLRRKLPRVGGCFATAVDGCFGACDAALHQPYRHEPHNRGIFFQTEAELVDFAKKANRAGLQIAMHAIGDAAVSRAVRAIAAALADFSRSDHRHTVIHASLITPRDLEKIAELGIAVTLQPGFLVSPQEPVAYLAHILGDRIRKGSPLRTMLDMGIHVSGGSDAPVIDPDPIEGLYGACNHPYDPGQSVSIFEALRMFTWEVARGSFDEKERGSLEKGKIADMVLLDRDPFSLAPAQLRSLEVETLFLAGKRYRPGMGTGELLRYAWTGRKERI